MSVTIAHSLKAPRAAGVAGLLFSALFMASVLLLRHQPASDASTAELKAFYLEGSGRHVNLVGLYLAPFAGIAFLWFIAAVRSNIGHRADRFFDTVFLGSGMLFVAMVFASAAAAGAFAAALQFQDANAPVSGGVAVARAFAYTLLFTFAVRMAAVFMIVTSTLGLKTTGLPRWFVYVSWTLAVLLLLSVSFFELIIVVFPAWVAAISCLILVRSPPEQPA